MTDLRFICVSGFFASGSSAVVDLLKEMKGFYECGAEMRIIRDPYGIRQLENALVNEWELINSSAAITDFLWLCKICARRRLTPFSPVGLGYTDTISNDFMNIITDYVDDLAEYKYKIEYYYHKFKKPYIKYIIDRFRFGIEHYSKGRFKTANRNIPDCFFSCPSQEEFNSATKKMFRRLFEKQSKEGYTDIILDQAVSPNNTSVIHRYFDDAKMIIVDRDPRDMFIDDVTFGVVFDSDYSSADAGVRYSERQRKLRESIDYNDKDVLYIRFEDLILNYESSVKSILDFLGLDEVEHINKKKFLNPDISKKNIGIWKGYNGCKEALDTIASLLPDLCIDYKD